MAVVYLSSTYLDLKEEREAVTQWLIKARHEVRHSYRANTEPLVSACEQDVEGSDIYLLLAGQRYGEVPMQNNPEQLSITELEFRAAKRAGKPIVALCQANPPFDLTDHASGDAVRIAALRRFHEAVKLSVTPDRFANHEQLIAAVSTGITEVVRKLEDKRREHAPPITPGVNRPHPRLLSRSLLLVHAAGADDALARRLTESLTMSGIQWRVERHACRPEEGIDWLGLDRQLADPNAVVATIAPYDPPAHPVEATLRGNGVLRVGNLVTRFLVALDPQCELNLGSAVRLRRWLRLNIPETLATFSTAARDERRAQIRLEAGLG